MAASCVLEAHSLALLTQVLTAFSTEALAGHVDAFDPAVARLRPHPGQTELCNNISFLLRDSQLVGNDRSILAPLLWRRTMPQDRYSIRTAPQWLCPLVECLTQVTKTLEIEINSVTDNPLVDVENKAILHAGNFQALSVADTMDRLRLQLHNAGRLIFAQHSELINPALSQGLPANLAWGHPGTDFGFKGLDVSMASYLSELGDLALPMSVHVQSAELHNQAVNSLALISARKTARAIEILQMMSACLIASLCQAADLRALESNISKRIREVIIRSLKSLQIKTDSLVDVVMNSFASKLLEHREIGWAERIDLATNYAVGIVVASPDCKCTITKLQTFGELLRRDVLNAVHAAQQEAGTGHGDRVLSSSAKNVYLHIRKTKKIPMYKDAKEFNVGRMLDQVLSFVQNRQELDQVILDCFEGIDGPALATFNPRQSGDYKHDSPDSDSDSVTARDSLSYDHVVMYAPPLPRQRNGSKSANSGQGSKQTASKLKDSVSLPMKQGKMSVVEKAADSPSVLELEPPITFSPPPPPAVVEAATAPAAQVPNPDADAVAIVGIGCRYPDGIESLDGFWDVLVNAKDLITDIPTQTRQSFKKVPPSVRGGWLSTEVVEEFDCGMFGMSPSEAKCMDPQHRIIMETVYSALEDANIPADALRGSDTGVFIGCRPTGHDIRMNDLYASKNLPRYTAVGSDLTFSANRISFWLDLKGPSFSLTSACSSGGVLLDLALRSLIQGQCKTAIVGAMSVISHDTTFAVLESAGIQTVEAGRCASYDKDADGYVPTESSVVFIVKRLDEAVKSGDRILATISGISDRHKGKEGLGITYPCSEANTDAINEVLTRANWTTDDVDFIEAHATGTKTGDPVEAAAIAKAFKSGLRTEPVQIGAVKSIVGHTENVAALTAMVKVVLAMRENSVIPTSPVSWPAAAVDKKSLVLAAGLGGSVIAVALKAAPAPAAVDFGALNVCKVLTISAASATSLAALRDSYVALISKAPEEDLARITVSSNLGRQHMRQRLALPAENKKALLTALDKWVPVKAPSKKQPIVFVFPGQGSLDLKACAELFKNVVAFRSCIEECTAALNELKFPSNILDDVFSGASEVRGEYEQTVLLILQYSIAKTMIKIGIEPSCVVGHSFGEIVATTVAGGLSLKDAIVLTHERHKPMLNAESAGVMASIFASLEVVQSAIDESGALVDVAAHNGKEQHVISGEEAEVEKVSEFLAKTGIQCRRLPNIIAFHSRRVAAASVSFQAAMKGKYSCDGIQVPLASCLTKTLMPIGSAIPLKHWVDHIVSPVLFASTISAIDAEYKNAIYIDIGSGSIGSLVRRHLTTPGADRQYLGALSSMGAVVANVYTRGVEIDWRQLHGDALPRSALTALPLYKYSRVPVWDDNVGVNALRLQEAAEKIPMQVSAPTSQSRIAVVGMAVRMPGGVVTLDHLWRVLKSDGAVAGSLPLDRIEYLFQNPQARKIKAAFIDEAFMMDLGMFGIAESDAHRISPRLRVQLETAYRAVESANIIPSEVEPYRAGVFSNTAAGSHDLYSNYMAWEGIVEKTIGANGLFVPEETGFIAQKVGFKTAYNYAINGYCESSITMLQCASDALQRNRVDVALTNSVRLFEVEGQLQQDSNFNVVGGGLVGEASVSLVLKRYEDAVRDKNHVYAVLGEATLANDYDRSNARAMATFESAKASGIEPRDIDLILWGPTVPRPGDVRLFTDTLTDTNGINASYALAQFGKIFQTGGIFGVVASSLMMQNSEIPSSDPSKFPAMYSAAQLKQMNVRTEGVEWSTKPDGLHRNAVVAVAGLHGPTAAVTVLENVAIEGATVIHRPRDVDLLVISANSLKSLAALCADYCDCITANAPIWPAFCQTTRLCRVSLKYKIAVTGTTTSQLSTKLKRMSQSISSNASSFLGQIASTWKLDQNLAISSFNGTQVLEAIIQSLGLKAQLVSIAALSTVKKPENTLVVGAGSPVHLARVRSALPKSSRFVGIVEKMAVEEVFAALYEFSTTAVFKGYDDLLEMPRFTPVQLPLYVFDRQVVKMPVVPGMMDLNQIAESEYIPTTFKNMPGTFDPVVHPVLFAANDWMVDHKLRNGKVILPGAALLNMALLALPASSSVASLTFVRAVLLNDNSDSEFVIMPTSGVDSFSISQEKDVYCQGTFSSQATSPNVVNISAKLAAYLADGEELDPQSWYSREEGAIAYGPRFQNVKILRSYEDGLALARVDLPANLSIGDWIVHPTLLDACFHMMAIVSTDGALPVGVENVWVSDSVRNGKFPTSVWCLRSPVEMENELQTGNRLEIFDAASGDCVMVVGALVVQVPGGAAKPEPLVWTNKWTPLEVTETAESQSIWLLVGDNTEVMDKLSQETKFARVIKADDDVSAMIDAIPFTEWSQDHATTVQIVYCGSLVPALDAATAEEWWKHGGYTLFLKVWNEMTSKRVKSVQSIGAVIVTPALNTDNGAVSRDAALTGLMLNVRLELRSSAKVLYLNPDNLALSMVQASSILKHPQDYDSGSYSLGGSRLETLKFVALEKAPRKQKSAKQLSILVTGGVGGLAKALADHFIAQGHKVTLAGRRDVTDESVQAALADIKDDRVSYIKLDVGDAVQVGAALKMGNFDGVIHTAGVLENGLFANVTDAVLKKIGKPKVEGALAILNGLPKDKPCTVVFTSSVAAAIGSFGQTWLRDGKLRDGRSCYGLGLVDGVGMAVSAADTHTSGEFLKSLEAPAAAKPEDVLAFIAEQMMILMGFDGDLDASASFSELGVDSVSSVSLQQSVEKKFGITVPLLDLFQLTSDSLAEEISERMMEALSREEEQEHESNDAVVSAEPIAEQTLESTNVGVLKELLLKNDICTVPDMLAHHMSLRPNNPLIQLSADPQDYISFDKFDKLSNAAMSLLVSAFDGIDLSTPPVVAIMSGTCPEAMIITMAVWKLGWTTAMLNPKTSVELLIRQAQAYITAATTVSGTLASPLLMVDSEKLFHPDGKLSDVSSAKLPVTADTPLCFLFSSSSVDGTSIKAARLTHGQVLENCKTRDLLWNMQSRHGRVLTWLPFSHVMGLIVDFVNNGLVSGMMLCLRPSRDHPATPDFLLDDALTMKPTLMYTVPWVLDSWVSTFTSGKDSAKVDASLDVLRGMKAVIAG
ncbi:hypothetical protein BDR26DRAFT_852386, partial [Obelidium mucronatum]